MALAAVSLFDLGTVPALHDRLSGHGPALVLCGAGTAAVGDMLGIVGRLLQGLAGVATFQIGAAYLGDITAPRIAIAEGVLFEGKCQMKPPGQMKPPTGEAPAAPGQAPHPQG